MTRITVFCTERTLYDNQPCKFNCYSEPNLVTGLGLSARWWSVCANRVYQVTWHVCATEKQSEVPKERSNEKSYKGAFLVLAPLAVILSSVRRSLYCHSSILHRINGSSVRWGYLYTIAANRWQSWGFSRLIFLIVQCLLLLHTPAILLPDKWTWKLALRYG